MSWQLPAEIFRLPASTLRRRFVKRDPSKRGRVTVWPGEEGEDIETRLSGLTKDSIYLFMKKR